MPNRVPRLTRVTGIASVLTCAVIAGTGGFLVGRYPHLTPYLPVHFGQGGIADRWQPKSWSLVLIPLWVQLSLALVFGAIALILLWRAAPSTAGGGAVQDQDDDARRMLAVAEGITLLAVVWIAFQGLGAVELVRLWDRGWGGFGPIYPIGLLVAIAVSGGIGLRCLAEIGRVPKRIVDEGPFWRLKVLYFNPGDPALFVPGRWGVGWTLNFGRPTAVALMVAILCLGIGVPFLIVGMLTR